MSGYHLTFRDWLGGAAIALPLGILAWQAGAWLWRKTAFVERLLKRRSTSCNS